MEKEPIRPEEDKKEASREFVEITHLLMQVRVNFRKLTGEEKEGAKRMIKSILSDVLE